MPGRRSARAPRRGTAAPVGPGAIAAAAHSVDEAGRNFQSKGQTAARMPSEAGLATQGCRGLHAQSCAPRRNFELPAHRFAIASAVPGTRPEAKALNPRVFAEEMDERGGRDADSRAPVRCLHRRAAPQHDEAPVTAEGRSGRRGRDDLRRTSARRAEEVSGRRRPNPAARSLKRVAKNPQVDGGNAAACVNEAGAGRKDAGGARPQPGVRSGIAPVRGGGKVVQEGAKSVRVDLQTPRHPAAAVEPGYKSPKVTASARRASSAGSRGRPSGVRRPASGART